jgi:hypothetical protein
MIKSSDIKVIKLFGKVEWLLLGGILAISILVIAFTALIFV